MTHKKKRSNKIEQGINKESQLPRREFLKMAAAGTASAAVIGSGGAVRSSFAQTPPPPNPAPFAPATIPSVPSGLLNPSIPRIGNWIEPWTWKPADWPGAQLELNVVANQNPGNSPSPGNLGGSIFSYNGHTPAPTIRVKSDGEVRIKIRNLMGLNRAETPIGQSPDPFEFPPEVDEQICTLIREQIPSQNPPAPPPCLSNIFLEQTYQYVHFEKRAGWSLKGHLNGLHAAHVTNLHTHGLHVSPDFNADGSASDNIKLRILSKPDWQARLDSGDPDLAELAEHEHVGELDYKIQMSFEHQGQNMPHPPGTHWYHPHAHGATHDQVASGMAGFLLVEGDVDEAINLAMTGESWPRPEIETGPYDYRERLMLLQRVHLQPADLDAGGFRRNSLRFPLVAALNGVAKPPLMIMRPGAVERWRVLNGSVDGAGTKRFMVLEGQYVHVEQRLYRVITEGRGPQAERQLEPVSQEELENAKMNLQQLSFDGITLVTEESGEAKHTIRDLSQQNAGTANPFAQPVAVDEDTQEAALRAYEACFKDGESLKNSFVRPNELFFTNANRADVFVKAPVDSAGITYTVLAQEAHLHTDAYQAFLQLEISGLNPIRRRPLMDVVIAYINVRGEPVEGGDFDIQSLVSKLPPVPPLLLPVREEELRIGATEAGQRGVEAGSARVRVVSYAGTGGADFPLVEVPDEHVAANPELENVTWVRSDNTNILMPNLTHTLAINTEFDLLETPEPAAPRKFAPDDPNRSVMLVDTAEEWVLYNTSSMNWGHTDTERFPQPGGYGLHYQPYVMTRAEGQERFWQDKEFSITNKGADHPFHMHINPLWVLRIDVPDETGELHNILPYPTWMDTVAIPRNGGRVVFRTRFDDFKGKWVNHCHILLHEDNGMMQEVECTDDVNQVNYHTRQNLASASMSGAEVDAIYPKPSQITMYTQSMTFVDPNEIGYQEYPGFELPDPKTA